MSTLDKKLLQHFNRDRFADSWIIGAVDTLKALEDITAFAHQILATSTLPIENNPNFNIVQLQHNATGGLVKYITVDQIRKLQNVLSTKNAEGQYKIAVIYQADLMNIHAANCCLKLLEEPGRNNFIFLITEAPHSLLPTIRSRCRKIDAYRHVSNNKDASDYTELLSYINDYQRFIAKLSGKIDKESVITLGKNALEMTAEKLKQSYSARLLYTFTKIAKILHNLTTFDLDPRVSFILLIEELSH